MGHYTDFRFKALLHPMGEVEKLGLAIYDESLPWGQMEEINNSLYKRIDHPFFRVGVPDFKDDRVFGNDRAWFNIFYGRSSFDAPDEMHTLEESEHGLIFTIRSYFRDNPTAIELFYDWICPYVKELYECSYETEFHEEGASSFTLVELKEASDYFRNGWGKIYFSDICHR